MSTTLLLRPMPAFPPPATAPIASLSQGLSVRELTDRIDAIATFYLSSDYLCQLSSGQTRQIEREIGLKSAIAPPSIVSIETIAAEYGWVCDRVWQLATSPSASSPGRLVQQVQKLCALWLLSKEQQPESALFRPYSTPTAAIQAAWQNRAIQRGLRQTTERLRSRADGQFVDLYPTCLAYTFGRVIHPVLQWNHRLAPPTQRER